MKSSKLNPGQDLEQAELEKREAHRAKRRAQAARRRERKAKEAQDEVESNAKRQKADEPHTAHASAPLDDAAASVSHGSPVPGTPATPYIPTMPSTAAASPAPTVASEVHIPEYTSRYDSSAYNSEYEMDVDTLPHAEDDRAVSQDP